MKEFNEMNKKELRAACKEFGVKNYGMLTTGGMRDSLKAIASEANVVHNNPFNQSEGVVKMENAQTEKAQNNQAALDAAKRKAEAEAEKAAKKAKAEAEAKAKAEAKAAKKAANAEAKAKAAAEKAEAKAAKAAEKEAKKLAEKMPEQNGMKMPKPGTKTRAIWDICANLSLKLGRMVKFSELKENVPAEANANMVKSQYAYWKKFNGYTVSKS